MSAAQDLPPKLADVVDDFAAVSERERLQLLLEFSEGLPELPERYREHPELLEPVPECQSPVFVVTELEDADDATPALDRTVRVFATAPREAPTTRGFAGILVEGLDGLPASELLAVPDDVSDRLGLARAVSPLRLRGMAGMLGRIKRQVRESASA
ncbi:SufE family protein [Quadrisphaera setariae]|uniref:SufE family protein n=1 Tax=Quadrisphaera setariae TaxID=2593304 RepID=UPI00210765C2|nr:SufE family protein [Quadrisphaera setariae]